jgi:hypothetical protein
LGTTINMLKGPTIKNRGDGSGRVWPDSGSSTTSDVLDIFAPRPFSPHISTIGYDYDFHRGIDVTAASGVSIYSPQVGSVQRWHYTHFGWEADSQLDQWTEIDPNTSVTFARSGDTNLRVTGSRVGSQTFPTDAGRFQAYRERVQITADEWELRLKLAAVSGTNGQLGFGLLDPDTDELVSMEYDGTTITARHVDSVAASNGDGDTEVISNQNWLRIRYDGSSYIYWERGIDQYNWTAVTSGTTGTYTSLTPKFAPVIYWRSTDSDATPDTVDIDFFGWFSDQTIPRFGNWLMIQNLDTRIMITHMREILVEQGDFIYTAGEVIGTAGATGFDSLSGPILSPHIHLEFLSGNNYTYANDDPVNPLGVGNLPRPDATNNVSVIRTTADDPDTVDSWKLAITVTRANQDFDVNVITLTGNLATRTVNFNTRAGLNANNDIPKNDGVYMVPDDFNASSPSYTLDVYFNKSVVGTTFTSYSIQDNLGTVLASE